MDRRKELAYELAYRVVVFAVLILSYFMTLDLLNDDNASLSFLKGCFIFLTPCAFEGIDILSTQRAKRKSVDIIEVTISVISIVACILLFISVFYKQFFQIHWWKWILGIYPLKVGINCFEKVYVLIKERYAVI